MTDETTEKAHPQVTRSPKSARELAGGGWIAPTPKALTRPPDFPSYYPGALKAHTEVILTEAYRKFGLEWPDLPLPFLTIHVLSLREAPWSAVAAATAFLALTLAQ
jgi:hypothetical protein